MERENMELYSEIQEHEAAQERTEARTAEIFAFFDEVSVNALCPAVLFRLTHASWSDIREMAGTATGGPAVVDASDCRGTKCC
jgi:hypothetical protein